MGLNFWIRSVINPTLFDGSVSRQNMLNGKYVNALPLTFTNVFID